MDDFQTLQKLEKLKKLEAILERSATHPVSGQSYIVGELNDRTIMVYSLTKEEMQQAEARRKIESSSDTSED